MNIPMPVFSSFVNKDGETVMDVTLAVPGRGGALYVRSVLAPNVQLTDSECREYQVIALRQLLEVLGSDTKLDELLPVEADLD